MSLALVTGRVVFIAPHLCNRLVREGDKVSQFRRPFVHKQ